MTDEAVLQTQPQDNLGLFFESRRRAASAVIGIIGLGILGMVGSVLADDTGMGALAVGVILVVILPIIIFIRVFSINKKMPLFKADTDGLVIRPTRHDDVVLLSWNEIEKVNFVKCAQKNARNSFLAIHTYDIAQTMAEAPLKVRRKLKKSFKHSGAPICPNLHGLNKEDQARLVQTIEQYSGKIVDIFPDHKQLEHYREIVRANNNVPPNASTYDHAARLAKTPKEIFIGVIIGIAIVPIIFIVAFMIS